MVQRSWFRCLVGVVLVVSASGCGRSDLTCLSSDAGKVCADTSDGSVRFVGSGLAPASEIVVVHPELDPVTYVVDEDGVLADDGSTGFLFYIGGVEQPFEISAIDADGEPINGEIIVGL